MPITIGLYISERMSWKLIVTVTVASHLSLSQYRRSFDPSQYRRSFDPSQYRRSFDSSQYRGSFDSSQYRRSFETEADYYGEYDQGSSIDLPIHLLNVSLRFLFDTYRYIKTSDSMWQSNNRVIDGDESIHDNNGWSYNTMYSSTIGHRLSWYCLGPVPLGLTAK